jgi:N-acetylmuramoyl-L-alanine amidase
VRPITQLVVHCSATQAKADVGVKEIDRWHRQRGFLRIGYHFVIRRDGTLETGRPLEQIGAHVSGHNKESIGICLVGGVQEDGKTAENNFTSEQFTQLAALLRKLREDYPNTEIRGHRDFPRVAKDCPSFDVKTWLGTVNINPKGN